MPMEPTVSLLTVTDALVTRCRSTRITLRRPKSAAYLEDGVEGEEEFDEELLESFDSLAGAGLDSFVEEDDVDEALSEELDFSGASWRILRP